MYMKRLFDSRNPDVVGLDRLPRENNADWLARAITTLQVPDITQWTLVVLVGGKDQLAFRLRLAQSHFRRDMLPSYWSECLLAKVDNGAISKVFHVPLIQPASHFAPYCNGVVETTVGALARTQDWPNIALLAFPKPQEVVLGFLDKFKEDRNTLDSLAHIIRWLAFIWGTYGSSNPVHDGIGMPSTCMVGFVCAAAQLDVTPGLPVSAACPEVLWSTVNYWHKQVTADGQNPPSAKAVYQIGHIYDIDDDAPKRKPKAKPAAAG